MVDLLVGWGLEFCHLIAVEEDGEEEGEGDE